LDSPVYHETVLLGQWTSIAIGILIAILTPLFLLQIFVSSKEPYLIVLYLVLDLFFILMFINFRKMEIVVYPKEMIVSFGIIKKKILFSEVLTCEPVSASLGVYTGSGIRVGGDGALAFITKIGGDAVKLCLEESRPFVFSTNNQDEVIDLILSLSSQERINEYYTP
jgi:hypothetical protein